MNRSSINTRYAKAYVSMAIDLNLIDQAEHDIRLLYAALSEYADFCKYMQDQRHNIIEKTEKIEALFSKEFNPLTIDLLKLIFHNKREEHLKDICRNAIEMIIKKKGIVNAKLTSAIELDIKIIDLICKKFEEQTQSEIEFITETNPALIGGFVLRINGLQYDASIATSLKELTKQLY